MLSFRVLCKALFSNLKKTILSLGGFMYTVVLVLNFFLTFCNSSIKRDAEI